MAVSVFTVNIRVSRWFLKSNRYITPISDASFCELENSKSCIRNTKISLFQFIQFDRYWMTFVAPTMSSKQNGPVKMWLNSIFQIEKSTWKRFYCIQPCHLKNINCLSLKMCMLNCDSLWSEARPPQCISIGQTSHAPFRLSQTRIQFEYLINCYQILRTHVVVYSFYYFNFFWIWCEQRTTKMNKSEEIQSWIEGDMFFESPAMNCGWL